jgi:hypothetical protein
MLLPNNRCLSCDSYETSCVVKTQCSLMFCYLIQPVWVKTRFRMSRNRDHLAVKVRVSPGARSKESYPKITHIAHLIRVQLSGLHRRTQGLSTNTSNEIQGCSLGRLHFSSSLLQMPSHFGNELCFHPQGGGVWINSYPVDRPDRVTRIIVAVSTVLRGKQTRHILLMMT